MKKNYLVIDTQLIDDSGVHWFTHFINLKEDTISDLEYLFAHLDHYKGQKVLNSYFSENRLTNW